MDTSSHYPSPSQLLEELEVPVLQENAYAEQARSKGTTTRRIGGLPLTLTLVTICITAGLATALFLWLVTHHAVQGQTVWKTLRIDHAFIVDEGTRLIDGGTEARLIGLTISSIASSFIGLTVPFVMTLYAYRTASTWITASEHRVSEKSLPTPLQFGLLLRLLGSSGVLSIFDTLLYLVDRKRPWAPPMLKKAFAVCMITWTLSHLIGLLDIWIHTSTHAIVGANFTSGIVPQTMSVAFSDSICQDYVFPTPCLQGTDSWGGSTATRNSGFLLAANSSSDYSVVTLADSDDTALVVPADVNTTTRFTATSFGGRAQCASLNPSCSSSVYDDKPVVKSCANVGYPMLPYWGTGVNVLYPILNGSVISQGNSIEVESPSLANPFQLIVQLRWPTAALDASVASLNTAVDSDDANSTMTLYASCNFTFLNTTFEYANGAFALQDETPSSPDFANIMWGPLINGLATSRLASDLQATAQADTNADNVMAALGQDLSRLALGMMGGAFVSAPALEQQEVTSKTLGRYSALPVLLFCALLWLYALFALYVFLATASTKSSVIYVNQTSSTDVSQLDITQARLTNPLPLVADQFKHDSARLNARLSVESPMRMFVESRETSRVFIGLGDERYPAYGLHRRFMNDDDVKAD